MELTPLSQLCLSNISANARRYPQTVIQDLPRLILDQLSHHLSAYWLYTWHDIFTKKDVDVNLAWMSHYTYQKSKLRSRSYERLRMEEGVAGSDFKQFYMERYFHELLWFVLAPNNIDPLDPRHRFHTEMHKLKQVNIPQMKGCFQAGGSAEAELQDYIHYVRRLSLRTSVQCSYLLMRPGLMSVLQSNIRTLTLHQLSSRHYQDMVEGLLKALMYGARALIELELLHVNLELPLWHSLLSLASGKLSRSSDCAHSHMVKTENDLNRPGIDHKRKLSSSEEEDDHDRGDKPSKKRCSSPAALDLYDEGLLPLQSETASPSSSSNNKLLSDVADGSCVKCAAEASEASTELTLSSAGLRSICILSHGPTDFTGLLGISLQKWPNLHKLVINQPVSNSYKVVILQEINKRVESGQLNHLELRGCLAAANQIEQLYNALHTRHINGLPPMDYLELESSFVWTGNNFPLPYLATSHGGESQTFCGVRHLGMSESTMVDEACRLLARWIQYDKALTTISLSALKLGMMENAIPAVLDAMAENGRLQVICLSDLILTPEANPGLVKLIRSSPELVEFSMENCHLEFDSDTSEELFQAIGDHRRLEKLRLSGSLLGEQACKLLQYIFTKPKPYPNIEHLYMNACRIQGSSLLRTMRNLMEEAASHPESSSTWRLHTLSLGGNSFGDHLQDIRSFFRNMVTQVHAWDVVLPQADHVSIM